MWIKAGVAVVVLGLVGARLVHAPRIAAVPNRSVGNRFIAVRDLRGWTSEPGALLGETALVSPTLKPGLPFDQVIVSWNSTGAPDQILRVEARALYGDRATKFYTLGVWSPDDQLQPRESVRGQKDADGNVETDTLVLRTPAEAVQLRVSPAGANVRFLGLSFVNTRAPRTSRPPHKPAWDKTLPVPERSQLRYADQGGKGWCSPTSTSMVLAYWAEKLKRPELNNEVPVVARGVFDRNWPGTGNWPFNTAYAGTFPGMRAYVTRFSSVAELEEWVAAGVPVICSVSYRLLKGRPTPEAGGHIVVATGFTKSGDVVMNDPWAYLEKGEKVRKVFSRKNLEAGWGKSHNTVYLIYPEGWKIPPARSGNWEAAR
jgi:hypothetical protein